ncbi:MAG: pyruvate, phosphate dikinase [Bacilli bacterium]|nr:pyruvate, phosphate dikinase [Bacilli bacterium]MDD4795991.1 pyruvate, phosphate dikinase [Bacilli bacterium]
MKKHVYLFSEGNREMRNLLGGKGANLAEMTSIGLPVPQGFIVTTECCTAYYEAGEKISDDIQNEILDYIKKLEKIAGKEFGNPDNPLLVSVRSGSRASMPGMMDTVLNLGINDEVTEGLARLTDNAWFAYDSYRRFIQMFADVVMGYSKASFERDFDEMKKAKGAATDQDLTTDDMKEVVKKYKDNYLKVAGESFPTDPKVQLMEAIKAVFRSWNNERANVYRRLNNIPYSWGTAVNIQEMVYGNMGNTSGSGVAFTRNPATGENKLYGEYLINSQGEDVVAGIRTPEPISSLKTIMPEVYEEFEHHAKTLEDHYQDMQDMEFTIENGKLYMLQTRNGKRTAKAAIKIAIDLYNEGKITKEEAIMKVDPNQLDSLLHPSFSADALKNGEIIGTGLAASPGAATGKIYFTAEDAVIASEKGEKEIILARLETSPEDIEGMNIAEGILTIRGGMTSHAAVVARGMGTCAVCGCDDLVIDEKTKTLKTKTGETFNEGDFISLDGSTGHVYKGRLETVETTVSGDFGTFMSWVDEIRDLEIRTNADSPNEAKIAKEFGATGIGLCRTEHMFFEESRIETFRKMILSQTEEDREKALAEILPYQQNDFEGIFREMAPYPVIIRYLDPPLHEFLPKEIKEIEKIASDLNVSVEIIKNKIEDLKEFNPMMGHRGCRLAITYPEIAKMQTKAVINAAINVARDGKVVKPEIMIPLVGDKNELKYITEIVREVADDLIKESGIKLDYLVGTMIELPRACILAGEIAEHADFFSFGTNDLTQMTYGFSRDDASKFLSDYYKKQIFESDPFARLDVKGVGALVEIAIAKGKEVNPKLEIGICGEHAGEASSIEFCYNQGMNYVSCSPYRVPIAKLAAAQAAIKAKKN